MPNNYFQFKQFTIQQQHCAMKVCTDACLFGAWAVESLEPKAQSLKLKAQKILDIGTGTGLLSLMFAQKFTDAIIDAVEMDEAAAMQATANFQASPWKERLKVYNTTIQQFNQSTIQPINQSINQLYNFIICNPPFFDNDLKSSDQKRNLALHSEALSLEELIIAIDNSLETDGNFAVLLPYHRTKYFEQLAAAKNFHLAEKMLVKQTPKHGYFRSMLLFGREPFATVEKEIIIKNESNAYTIEFAALLKDYYLNL